MGFIFPPLGLECERARLFSLFVYFTKFSCRVKYYKAIEKRVEGHSLSVVNYGVLPEVDGVEVF